MVALRRVALQQVELSGFRNLTDGTVSLSSGINLVSGRNGQGKTNLLEAVYLLGTTKSFRRSPGREMVRIGQNEAVVAGALSADPDRLAVRLQCEPPAKELACCSERVSAARYIGRLTPVAFTAESRHLVQGPPELRRSFLDRGATSLHQGHIGEVAALRRALRQKAALLERAAQRAELEAWNEELAARASTVAWHRRRFVEVLKKNSRSWRPASSAATRIFRYDTVRLRQVWPALPPGRRASSPLRWRRNCRSTFRGRPEPDGRSSGHSVMTWKST